MVFSTHASEAATIALGQLAQQQCSEDEIYFIESLAKSNELHRSVNAASLADEQIAGFFATAITTRMNYSFFRQRLRKAVLAQQEVSELAAKLGQALESINDYEFVCPELRYAHSFLHWAGITTDTSYGLEAVSPLHHLFDKLEQLAEAKRPTESCLVAAAISSQKASAPHEFVRSFLYMTPQALRDRLCPAIAIVVSLAHPEGMTVQEVRRLLKDLPPETI
jgi:hypothetical protein